jgi:SAM-dependent methyltransferase
MATTQRHLAERALQLLDLPTGVPALLLDAGCGTGYSARPLEKAGHHWIGTDISINMLQAARQSARRPGLRPQVVCDDLGHGFAFRVGTFDGCISISAVQWLCHASKAGDDPQRRLRRFFVGLKAVLVAGALFLPMGFARVENPAPPTPVAKVPTDPKTLPAGGSTASLKPIPAAAAELNSASQSQSAAPTNPRAVVPPIDTTPQVLIEGRFIEIRDSLPPELVGVLSTNRSAVRLTAARTRDLTKVLEGLDGTDILTAPRVTTHVNFQAQISVLDQAQISVLEARAVIDGKVLQSLVSPSTDPDPSTVRKVSVGPTLRVMANMSPASSNLIELVADASIVQMLGYEPASNGASEPLIRTNLASGRERIWDGQSVLMDAGALTNRVHFVDKVPYLGDLPLIGRFFRKEGTQDQVSRLLVLVTPTLIDATGRPIHDPAHPPFDPATFPPKP